MRFLLAAFIFLSPPAVYAWPRLGHTSTPVYNDTGTAADGFSVTVTSGTARLVYSGVNEHREIFFQNTSSDYDVHCGTFSAVTDNSGVNRWVIRADRDVTTNGTYDVYCVAEDGAGSTSVEITGNIEYDPKD